MRVKTKNYAYSGVLAVMHRILRFCECIRGRGTLWTHEIRRCHFFYDQRGPTEGISITFLAPCNILNFSKTLEANVALKRFLCFCIGARSVNLKTQTEISDAWKKTYHTLPQPIQRAVKKLACSDKTLRCAVHWRVPWPCRRGACHFRIVRIFQATQPAVRRVRGLTAQLNV